MTNLIMFNKLDKSIMIILRNGLVLLLLTLLFGCGSIPKTKVFVSPATIKLMKAAKSGNEQIVKKMLKTGLNINVKDASGWTALHKASFGGHTKIAKFLINKGIMVDAKDVDAWTALLVATANNRINVVRLLIQKRANVNVKDLDGMTPLHIAAINNYLEIAKLLIQNGADANATNNDGITPLQIALSLRRSNEMIALLAGKSPDAEAVKKDNYKEIKPQTSIIDQPPISTVDNSGEDEVKPVTIKPRVYPLGEGFVYLGYAPSAKASTIGDYHFDETEYYSLGFGTINPRSFGMYVEAKGTPEIANDSGNPNLIYRYFIFNAGLTYNLTNRLTLLGGMGTAFYFEEVSENNFESSSVDFNINLGAMFKITPRLGLMTGYDSLTSAYNFGLSFSFGDY